MNTSASITNISAALLLAQKKIGGVAKDGKNPFYKRNYAPIESVLEVVKEPLNLAGIVLLQPVCGDTVQTVLLHAESGEWISGETRIVNAKENDPQAQGSAITYARRYGLISMLALAAEDDDGESAVIRNGKTKTTAADPEPNWRKGKPTEEQIRGALNKASYQKLINNVEETEKLKAEMKEWTAGEISDFLGNKATLNQIKENH